QLDMDSMTAAYGLSEVVDENMANAARVHAVENGEDLAEYTMIAFGGAAPLHAGRLCEKLSINRVLVPPGAGVGSAIGFLRAPFSFEANRSIYMRLSDFAPKVISELLTGLASEATGFVRSCDANAPIETEYKVYMRYSGQGEEIPVLITEQLAKKPLAVAYKALFEAEYSALFGRIVDGMDIEITVWSANATTIKASVDPVETLTEKSQAQSIGSRSIFDPALGEVVEASIFPRKDLTDGDKITGPAVITEDETTIILPTSRYALRQPDGCIDVLRKANGVN
ncbi:MAG: N-methylhydantoinase A, partial [Gammaproteobacteria bacterium]